MKRIQINRIFQKGWNDFIEGQLERYDGNALIETTKYKEISEEMDGSFGRLREMLLPQHKKLLIKITDSYGALAMMIEDFFYRAGLADATLLRQELEARGLDQINKIFQKGQDDFFIRQIERHDSVLIETMEYREADEKSADLEKQLRDLLPPEHHGLLAKMSAGYGKQAVILQDFYYRAGLVDGILIRRQLDRPL